MEQKRKIVPPVYLLITLLLMYGFYRWLPLMEILGWPARYGGAFLMVFGGAMTAMSAGLFKKVDTGLVPFDEARVLVTSGFFRYTRNPMYLGMVLLLLGFAILSGALGPFIPIPFFVWIIRNNFILGEERFMEAAFGEEYLSYKKLVRRWM